MERLLLLSFDSSVPPPCTSLAQCSWRRRGKGDAGVLRAVDLFLIARWWICLGSSIVFAAAETTVTADMPRHPRAKAGPETTASPWRRGRPERERTEVMRRGAIDGETGISSAHEEDLQVRW
jgi:hypothetical protein